MAWNKTSDNDPAPAPAAPRTNAPGASAGHPSTLGPSISIKGTLKGSEDLRIEGAVEGTIRFDKQYVLVSQSGRIKADIFASKICVEGEVQGNLHGEREIIILPSGKLEGNITAPSVTLENGAKFRGSIDMEPTTERNKQPAAGTGADKSKDKPRSSTARPGVPTPATAGSS